jgi:hypothetical protein
VPTFRVIYDPRPGVRLLIEDVVADAIIETPLHLVLTVDALVVGQPREVVALRVRRRDVTAILRLCRTSARWGGVLLHFYGSAHGHRRGARMPQAQREAASGAGPQCSGEQSRIRFRSPGG